MNARAAIDAEGFEGHTPLFHTVVNLAAGMGLYDDSKARLLLDHGADPNARATFPQEAQFHGKAPTERASRRYARRLCPPIPRPTLCERPGDRGDHRARGEGVKREARKKCRGDASEHRQGMTFVISIFEPANHRSASSTSSATSASRARTSPGQFAFTDRRRRTRSELVVSDMAVEDILHRLQLEATRSIL